MNETVFCKCSLCGTMHNLICYGDGYFICEKCLDKLFEHIARKPIELESEG